MADAADRRVHQHPLARAELRRVHLSVRTFSRRLREETGTTPGQWLNQQRVDHARRLLETTDLTVDRVAAAPGFGTAVSLRQHLAATLGVSPTAYRQTFRARERPDALPDSGPAAGALTPR
ncbi:helix-turn-helix domain-containing protein [Streptomyces purpureus]|uniref:helix-turn-helix domain-containing protein n=1 Tax=Streptomyces purpureus TaxID=1951 RepID=UPI0037A7F13C